MRYTLHLFTLDIFDGSLYVPPVIRADSGTVA